MKTNATQKARLLSALQRELVIRARDLDRWHMDRKALARARQQGWVERCARGTYCLPHGSRSPDMQLATACKRVPHGTVCLLSALCYHGLLAQEPARIWMAVGRKARLPQVGELPCQFVRYSGEAFTQGLMNAKLHGTPVRVYSPMKTVADCFKYRDKIGREVGREAITTAIKKDRYNRQKLLRFAEICRVEKVVAEAAHAAERAARQDQVGRPSAAPQIHDPELLRQAVWAEPLRQIARRYGISDVALAKRCKKLNIPLPGRSYWAKKSTTN